VAIRSRIEEADASCTLPVLRCTEVSPPTVEMGHSRPGSSQQQVQPRPLCPDSDENLQHSEMSQWAMKRLMHRSKRGRLNLGGFLAGTKQTRRRLDRRDGALGIVSHRRHDLKKFRAGLPPGPRGKEVKLQGVSVLPTRKPTLLLRSPRATPLRSAARRSSGESVQEPPRTTR